MSRDSQLQQDLAALFKRNKGDIKPGLERISEVLELIDNPQQNFLAIHIAGTNGKGSVAALLESILRAHGLRTGLYTSPHLVRFNERIKIDGQPIDDDALRAAFEPVRVADARREAEGRAPASFFEMGTAIAFQAFADSGVAVAVIETGMGGRWDSTNVIRPLVCAITPISIEHSRLLGDTLTLIAGEKAGIIKPGVPVVIAPQEDEARAVFAAAAAARAAPLRWVAESASARCLEESLDGQRLKIETDNYSYPPALCPLLGGYQLANCAQAVAAAEEFFAAAGLAPDPAAVKRGIEQLSWPGRAQVFSRDPLLILDGAHNPAAAVKLRDLLVRLAGKRRLGLIVSFLDDKDAAGFMRAFKSCVERCWIVPLDSARAMPAEDISAAVKPVCARYEVCTREQAHAAALDWARRENGVVCVTGSLYLLGEFLR
jgi:dihydrofolate synthase / folylpolyglutamate synthase